MKLAHRIVIILFREKISNNYINNNNIHFLFLIKIVTN